MEPNTNPQPTAPPPPGVPQPPAMPAAAPAQPPIAPNTPPAPAAAPQSPAPHPDKSSQKHLILIAVIAGFLAIVAALVLAWFFFWTPAAQAKRVSNSFMKAITTGDVDKAVELSGDADSRDFLEKAADSVKGSYKLSESTYKNSKGYYLYTLSDADSKYARTVIAKDEGKLVVSSFVYTDDKPALVPGDSKDSTTSSNSKDDTDDSSSTPTDTSASTSCLGPDDFKAFLSSYTLKPNADGRYTYTDSIFFTADSTEYAFPALMAGTYEKYKTFYAQKSGKDFTITLSGEVNSAEKDDVLANQRAEKFKADLVAQSGIPASRIIIGTPTNENAEPGSGGNAEANRAVGVAIRSSDSCKK